MVHVPGMYIQIGMYVFINPQINSPFHTCIKSDEINATRMCAGQFLY